MVNDIKHIGVGECCMLPCITPRCLTVPNASFSHTLPNHASAQKSRHISSVNSLTVEFVMFTTFTSMLELTVATSLYSFLFRTKTLTRNDFGPSSNTFINGGNFFSTAGTIAAMSVSCGTIKNAWDEFPSTPNSTVHIPSMRTIPFSCDTRRWLCGLI